MNENASSSSFDDGLFCPPVDQWQKLHPNYLKYRILNIIIQAIVLIVLSIGLTVFVIRLNSLVLTWLGYVLIGLAVGMTLFRLLRTRRFFHSWGYAERGEDIYLTRGLAFRNLTCIPYGRMQLVEVSAGPVQRIFGLATIEIVTASSSGTISIPGLGLEQAQQLRDRFIDRGEQLQAGI